MTVYSFSSSGGFSSDLPLIGFGTFIGLGEEAMESSEGRQALTEETIFKALQVGYRHFDCAHNYENEEWIGNAFRKAFKPKSEGGLGLSREDLFITTKGTSTNLKDSLAKLGIEYSDLHLSHFPETFSSIEVLLEEWKNMNLLVDNKVAKRIGVSNHYRPHMERLLTVCEEASLRKPYANEIEIHTKLQEHDFVEYCQAQDVRVIAFSPLGYTNNDWCLKDEIIIEIAKEKLMTPAQVVLAWNMKRGVTVIPKSKSPEHMLDNLAAQKMLDKLDDEDMAKIKTTDWKVHFNISAEASREAGVSIDWGLI